MVILRHYVFRIGCYGTISYEVLCGVSRRVPRVYLEHGKIVDVEDWILEA